MKYAGNWRPDRRDAWSYSFQRWWLERGLTRALVTVNGTWPSQRSHVRSFFNPCLTEDERRRSAILGRQKQINGALRMISAGRVESAKGIEMALQVLARLLQEGIPATLDIAGDGPKRIAFEQMAVEMNLAHSVLFHGWIPRTNMGCLYAGAHIILLPTVTEGWPKVLSEAMAYGVVPVASEVGSIGQYLRQFSTGRPVPADDLDGFVEAVKFYLQNPHNWKDESERGMLAAENFTYEAYQDAVKNLLNIC